MRADVAAAVEVLRRGGLVALPTETVYGLAADACSEAAVRRIFAVKGRPSTHPVIVHLGEAAWLDEWAVNVPPLARDLARSFWPGPLTLILERSPKAIDAVTGGASTIGLRMPKHDLALEVIRAFGGALAAPSANRFGRVSPTTAAHVREDLGGDVDLVLDGGPCEVGIESTIVDLSSPEPAIVRPGAVTREDIELVAGRPVPPRRAPEGSAPGTHRLHYAPRAEVVLSTPAELAGRAQELARRGLKVAVLGPARLAVPAEVSLVPLPGDLATAASVLYAALREVDAQGHDAVVVAMPAEAGVGEALADRLRRAAGARAEGP